MLVERRSFCAVAAQGGAPMPIVNRVALTTTGDFQDGLDAFGTHGPVLNFAPITTTGMVANGIVDFGQGAHVINRDAITVTGDGGVGILAVGDHVDITNFAAINNFGNTIDPDGIPFDGDETFAEGILVLGNNANVVNRGPLTVTGVFAAGLDVEGANSRAENDGAILAPGTLANGFLLVGDGAVGVNNGTILTGSLSNPVVAVGDGLSFTNAGAISSSGDFAPAVVAVGANVTLVNAHGATIDTDGRNSFGMYAQGDGATIENDGIIHASGQVLFGLIAEAANSQVTNTGLVAVAGSSVFGAYVGDHGALLNRGFITVDGSNSDGLHTTLEGDDVRNLGTIVTTGVHNIGADLAGPGMTSFLNSGSIRAIGDGSEGLFLRGAMSTVLNHGLIEATGGVETTAHAPIQANAVDVFGDQDAIRNAQDGRIYSHNAASAAVLLNVDTGTVVADPTAHTTLENDGLIHGDGLAILGGVASEAVFNFGRIEGGVNLGDGADRYEAESGGTLVGTLTLGGGADTLALHHNFGALTVADFTPGGADHDVLDVSALGIKTLVAFLGSASQVGADVLLNLGHGDLLTLKSLTLASLSAGDFIFAH